MHDHFSITSSPWPWPGQDGSECWPSTSHGDEGWACVSQKALELMGDAGRCRSYVPGGPWAGHRHLSVSFTSPSRRAVSGWAAMGGCWCGVGSDWCQQLSRTSREPQFSPGFFFVSQISSVCQLSTLNSFDNPYSLPNMI